MEDRSTSVLDQTGIPDILPYCPIKTIMWEELTPLLPEPVPEERPEPRVWQYRVCLSLFSTVMLLTGNIRTR